MFCDYYSGGTVTHSADPVYTMPDLGYRDGNRLYLVGRVDEVVNLSGTKILFSRFEGILREIPGIADVGTAGNVPLSEWTGQSSVWFVTMAFFGRVV